MAAENLSSLAGSFGTRRPVVPGRGTPTRPAQVRASFSGRRSRCTPTPSAADGCRASSARSIGSTRWAAAQRRTVLRRFDLVTFQPSRLVRWGMGHGSRENRDRTRRTCSFPAVARTRAGASAGALCAPPAEAPRQLPRVGLGARQSCGTRAPWRSHRAPRTCPRPCLEVVAERLCARLWFVALRGLTTSRVTVSSPTQSAHRELVVGDEVDAGAVRVDEPLFMKRA